LLLLVHPLLVSLLLVLLTLLMLLHPQLCSLDPPLLILSPTLGLLLNHALPLMRLLQYALSFSSSLVLMVLRLSPTKLLLSL